MGNPEWFGLSLLSVCTSVLKCWREEPGWAREGTIREKLAPTQQHCLPHHTTHTSLTTEDEQTGVSASASPVLTVTHNLRLTGRVEPVGKAYLRGEG